ncbi:MocR-like pyridoxine biosynthesis transcription factor PdxR [Rugosimonospora africana]|uniref:GntR family transcriptional regulator n=1 Tax=Rugosimonospora africana TaxID=556532 RepID=A0A8J3R348_9ACTN|nr:PLP-dependent aminotransferase family protein [Rugosimonospora africana]GIH21391.1 GntR family transcriptional regulator [Rugosimonospora africana]
MDLHVSLAGRGDLAARIYRQILDAILDGRLRAGERLPPTRELARRLDVSRNTVAVAYDRLTAEGFLHARVGAGTFVATADRPDASRPSGPEDHSRSRIVAEASTPHASPRPARRGAPRRAPGGSEVAPRPLWNQVVAAHVPSPPTAAIDFRVGNPDPALFPIQTWRRLVGRELRRASFDPGGYGDPAGHAGLRAAIARHVGLSRSVRAGADDIVVTQGAQQALDLIGRVLVEPGATVAVENPGYRPARLLFRSLGARVVGVPVDDEGLDVAALPAGTRLVYTTPSHQFPLGAPMSLARRTALLDWAGRHGAVIVEDDYDSEFRYGDRPLEPLQSLDRHGRVAYVGSFSKTMLPGLRLGFLVTPASLRPALHAAKRLTDYHGDIPAQGALARFIDEGMLSRHVRRARREYGARRDLLLSTLADRFGEWLEPVPSAAGLHVCARLRAGVAVDIDDVVDLALRAGVAVEGLAGYYAQEPRAGLVIGYGAVPRDLIAPGLRILLRCFREADRSGSSRGVGRAEPERP